MASPVKDYLPYANLTDDLLAKASAPVSLADKRTVISALGDDSVLTLVIQQAFHHAATFIRANNIVSYDPTTHDRFIKFICDRADPCVNRQAVAHPVAGGTESLQHPASATSCVSSGRGESSQGGIRKQDKKSSGGKTARTDKR